MQSMLDDDIGCDIIGCGPFTSLFSRCCSCSRGYLLASVDEDDDAFDISAPNKKKDKACAYGTTESALVDNGFVRSPPVGSLRCARLMGCALNGRWTACVVLCWRLPR